jgi:hypothetical protein
MGSSPKDATDLVLANELPAWFPGELAHIVYGSEESARVHVLSVPLKFLFTVIQFITINIFKTYTTP